MRWHCHSSSMFWKWIFGGCLLAMASATYPPMKAQTQSYSKSKPEFMPSEPGEAPSCLKDPRLTYCTDPDDYPKERILYLLKNNMFDMSTILMDETRDTYTFEAMDAPMPMYDYSPPQQGYLPPVQTPSPSYGNASHYNQQPKSSYYARPTPSKYGSPSQATPFVSQAVPASSAPSGRRVSRPGGMRYRRQAPADGGGGTDDLCPSRASYITPRAAQSIQGDWMYLVNLDDDPRYTQLVRSETCVRNQCSGACQAPPDSVAVCQQQFVQRRLVALAGTGQTLNQDIFWFPSCCVCKIGRR